MERIQFDSDAGGTTLRITVFNEVDGTSRQLEFHKQPVRLGRNSENDVVLGHQYVSGWHAELGLVGGALHLLQVGASNSVQVDGRKLQAGEAVLLTGEETIRIVPFTIGVQLDLVALQTPATGSVQPASSAPMGTALEVLDQICQRVLGRTLAGEEEAAELALGMARLLRRLLGLFIALRQGQEQFLESVDVKSDVLEKDQLLRGQNDPDRLAALLLGPDSSRSLAALEEVSKSITVHQVALLKGLMAGVRNLIGKLGPGAVIHEAAKKHSSPGYKVLWETFVKIYGDLAEEGSDAFKALFGSKFSKSYSRMMGGNQ